MNPAGLGQQIKTLVLLLTTIWPLFAGAETFSGRVVGISDGDTITVLDAQNRQHRVRLVWIDAPEKGQPYGQEAKENLSMMVYGRAVKVFWEEKDRYGRIVGQVAIDERYTGLEQLRSRLA